MNKKIVFTCIFAGALFCAPVHSQSLIEKLARKAAEKAEKRAKKKAEGKLDKEFDAAEKSPESDEKNQEKESQTQDRQDQKERSMADIMGKMGISSQPVHIEDNYVFNASITMNMKSYDKNGELKSDGDIVTYIKPGQNSSAYEFAKGDIKTSSKDQKGLFILDFKNMTGIVLSDDDGKKTGIAYGIDNTMDKNTWQGEKETEEQMEISPDSPYMNPNIKKTERIKSILGYKCDEYEYSDENNTTSFWVTKEFQWDSKDFMSNVFKSSMYSHGMPWGFLMESNSVDHESGEKSTYQVIDINKDKSKSFNMSDYQITNIGSMNMQNE